MNDVFACINNRNKCDKGAICNMINDTCTLILPKFNLVTDSNNEKMYYARLADELIRYKTVRSFMFSSSMYLSFDDIGYSVNFNEIIVMQDLLIDNSVDSLFWDKTDRIPSDNQYVQYNTYDTANPQKSQLYNNKVPLSKLSSTVTNGNK